MAETFEEMLERSAAYERAERTRYFRGFAALGDCEYDPDAAIYYRAEITLTCGHTVSVARTSERNLRKPRKCGTCERHAMGG